MILFSNASIKQKIRIILILISGSVLVVAALSFSMHYIFSLKKDTVQKITTIAEILGKDASFALAFNDPEAARDTLATLESQPDIITACIFDRDGEPFARYKLQKVELPSCDPKNINSSVHWDSKFMDIAQPIIFDGEPFGSIVIRYSLDTIRSQIRVYIVVTSVIFLVLIFFIFVVSVFFEKVITDPVLNLKETADYITSQKDYSIQVKKLHSDEIGDLVDGFNRMLLEIQKRDKELAAHNEVLEETVKERTFLLELQNKELADINNSLEVAVQKAEEMAQKADEANVYKSLFLANMSHEIRTPMNAILGFTELLEEKIQDVRYKQYLSSISSAGRNLLRLINDILDLSKIEANMLELRYKPVQIENIIKDVGQIFSKSIEDKGLEFRIIYGSDLPEYLFLDGDRLIQILINLVGNAIKFTSRGFVEIEVSAHLTNDYGKVDITIRVKDSGVGIALSQQDVIFESFRQHSGQDSNQYGGTGLGLTISRQLINMMHGEISLESSPGSGAVFTVFFKDIDIVQQDESELPSSVHSNVSVVFSPSTLLIVDDSEINRTLLKYYLEDTNLHVIEAEDEKQALAAVEKESVDLILVDMDMEMPIMDGYEAVTRFRKNPRFADIPIITTTASVMDFSRKQMFESGCDDILEKPITKYGFLELLQRYLPYEQLSNGNRLTAKSGNEQDFSLDGGSVTPEMKANICSFLVIYRKDLASTFNEVQETSLMVDIAMFAQDVRVLANVYNLDFIVRWSENCMKWADGFDVDNVMKTLDTFQTILTKMQTASIKPDD